MLRRGSYCIFIKTNAGELFNKTGAPIEHDYLYNICRAPVVNDSKNDSRAENGNDGTEH